MAGFEKLRIWEEAYKLMLEIHELAKKLPWSERFSLRSQIDRSSSSVPDNIAEGYSSFYYKDKLKGMYIARKEAAETQNHLRKMEGKKYISKLAADALVDRYDGLIKGINAFVRYIIGKQKENREKARDKDLGRLGG